MNPYIERTDRRADDLTVMPDARTFFSQILKRDRLRTKILAIFSLIFWLISAIGMLLLVFALYRFVRFVTLDDFIRFHFVASPSMIQELPATEQALFRDKKEAWLLGVNFTLSCLPYVGCAIVAMLLAATCTVWLVFTAREVALCRIRLSLIQISEDLRQLQESQPVATIQDIADSIEGYNSGEF